MDHKLSLSRLNMTQHQPLGMAHSEGGCIFTGLDLSLPSWCIKTFSEPLTLCCVHLCILRISDMFYKQIAIVPRRLSKFLGRLECRWKKYSFLDVNSNCSWIILTQQLLFSQDRGCTNEVNRQGEDWEKTFWSSKWIRSGQFTLKKQSQIKQQNQLWWF